MKNRVLGSVLIVTGTTIGAGMLALPLVTALLGFPLTCLLLIACWAIMTSTAFLVINIHFAFEESANFSTMAVKTLGRVGQGVTWVSFLFLLYALTAAYMTGGAALLQATLSPLLAHAPGTRVCALVFTLILGAFVCFGTRSVDGANRVLISLKAFIFVIMVIMLFPHVKAQNLQVWQADHFTWIKALPILITSFGFHIVIPNLRGYLHSDLPKLKRAVWIGSLIPLAIYLVWEVIILGIVPLTGPQGFGALLVRGGGLSEMIQSIEVILAKPGLGLIVQSFTDIAITTSFLGVSMSLLHFVMDGFKLHNAVKKQKTLGVLLTFLPPLLFAWFYPQGFVMALEYASCFVVILLIIIPVLMAYRLQKLNLWYGAALLLFALLVIAVQLFNFI
jgi:tyrosine-specific transport protein